MTDWSFDAFADAYDYAMEIRGSERYAELVRNCARAYEAELNWPAQFSKLKPALSSALGGRSVSSHV
jgi:hypothetical protein